MTITDKSGTLTDVREFVDNPEPRYPCVFIIDTSLSMIRNNALDTISAQMSELKEVLEQDHLASHRIELSVIAFGDAAKVVHDFATVDNFRPPHRLRADGLFSRMGQGIRMSLNHIETRKRKYWSSGICHYTPLAFMFTDCDSTGESQGYLNQSLNFLASDLQDSRLSFVTVAVPEFDANVVARAIPVGDRITLNTLGLGELFHALAISLRRASRSRTDAKLDIARLVNMPHSRIA